MPLATLAEALRAEVKKQQQPADSIEVLQRDQKCRATSLQVRSCGSYTRRHLWLRLTDRLAHRLIVLSSTTSCDAQDLGQFSNLIELSLASTNLVSLANFPSLNKLERLLLSDNRISGGLESLTSANLDQLQELDLSNNRVSSLSSFKPLTGLKSLQVLHVEANPVSKSTPNLRKQLFNMLATLQYIDNEDRFGMGRTLQLTSNPAMPQYSYVNSSAVQRDQSMRMMTLMKKKWMQTRFACFCFYSLCYLCNMCSHALHGIRCFDSQCSHSTHSCCCTG